MSGATINGEIGLSREERLAEHVTGQVAVLRDLNPRLLVRQLARRNEVLDPVAWAVFDIAAGGVSGFDTASWTGVLADLDDSDIRLGDWLDLNT